MKILQRILLSFLSFLGRCIHKKIIYVGSDRKIGKTAVLSSHGFWYVGDNYDYADITYGVLHGGEIEKEGYFVKSLIQKIQKNIPSSQKVVMYDIGANTGYFGILANTLGDGSVVTHFFEPLHEHVDCIEKTVHLNRIEATTHIHEIGLGNENTKKVFYTAGSGSSLDAEFIGKDKQGSIEIQVRTLDEYSQERKIESPDFLKIDVEGYEYFVLEGGEELIKNSLPIIYIEIAKDLGNIGREYTNAHYGEIFDFFHQNGYSGYLVDHNYDLVPFKEDDHIDSGVNMYLFIIEGKHSYIV